MALRALVLAAGLGTRLRPLTEDTPKPLLPVLGRPVVTWTLDRLRKLGCEAVAINLHHRGEKIPEALGTEYEGMRLVYSEEPEILGTLGALGPLKGFFADCEQVLVVNGDSLCRWPLKRLLRTHRRKKATATLLLSRRPDPRSYGGGVGTDRAGRVLSLSSRDRDRGEVFSRHVFAGAHVLAGELLDRVGPEPADFVSDLWIPLLEEGKLVQAVVTRRRWHDLGTPDRYLRGVLDWARGRGLVRLWRRSWIDEEVRVAPDAQIHTSVLEADVVVSARARVQRCLLLPGALIGPEVEVRHSILGPGTVLPEGSRVEGRLVVPQVQDRPPHKGDSVIGGMVYSNLAAAPQPEPAGDSSTPRGTES